MTNIVRTTIPPRMPPMMGPMGVVGIAGDAEPECEEDEKDVV
jgi:hypothetical protein